jgi:hypothetical protein
MNVINNLSADVVVVVDSATTVFDERIESR